MIFITFFQILDSNAQKSTIPSSGWAENWIRLSVENVSPHIRIRFLKYLLHDKFFYYNIVIKKICVLLNQYTHVFYFILDENLISWHKIVSTRNRENKIKMLQKYATTINRLKINNYISDLSSDTKITSEKLWTFIYLCENEQHTEEVKLHSYHSWSTSCYSLSSIFSYLTSISQSSLNIYIYISFDLLFLYRS